MLRAKKETSHAADRLTEIKHMSLEELDKETIQFGKAKAGVKFAKAFEDHKWTEWFVSQYEKSDKIAHQKYIAYVEKRLDLGDRSKPLQCDQTQDHRQEGEFRSLLEPCERGRDGERSQWGRSESQHRPVPEDGQHGGSSELPLRGEPVLASTPERGGSCTERADFTCQGAQSGTVESECFGVHSSIHDMVPDFEFSTPDGHHEQSFKSAVQKLVAQFTAELKTVNSPRLHQRRLDLLEVMCHSDDSELTKQTLHLGGKAQRFGLEQGDLNTIMGRMKLFQDLIKFSTETLMVQSCMQTMVQVEPIQ